MWCPLPINLIWYPEDAGDQQRHPVLESAFVSGKAKERAYETANPGRSTAHNDLLRPVEWPEL